MIMLQSPYCKVVYIKACTTSVARRSDVFEHTHSPASVAQSAEAQCAPAGTVCRRDEVQSPGRPADFVFGFHSPVDKPRILT